MHHKEILGQEEEQAEDHPGVVEDEETGAEEAVVEETPLGGEQRLSKKFRWMKCRKTSKENSTSSRVEFSERKEYYVCQCNCGVGGDVVVSVNGKA